MSSFYKVGQRVLVQLEGYPWWPAVVVPPEVIGAELPAGCDTCVRFYQSQDVSFVDSTNSAQVKEFVATSPSEATAEREADPSLAQAYDEAVSDDAVLPFAGASGAESHPPPAAKPPLEPTLNVNEDLTAGLLDDTQPDADQQATTASAPYNGEAEVEGRPSVDEYPTMSQEGLLEAGDGSDPFQMPTRADADSAHKKKRMSTQSGEESNPTKSRSIEDKYGKPKRDSKKVEERRSARLSGKAESARKSANVHSHVDLDGLDGTPGNGRPSSAFNRQMFADEDVFVLKGNLEAATARRDVAEVRKVLLSLSQMSTTFEQLKSTKVGVAVGNLLRIPEFNPVSTFVRALITCWAGQLPKECKESIAHAQTLGKNAGAALRQQSSTAAPTRTDSGFAARIKEHLTMDEGVVAELGISEDATNKIALAVEAALKGADTSDKRREVINNLRRPAHSQLRKQVLKGEVAPEQLVKFSGDDWLTPEEKSSKDAAWQERLAAMDEMATFGKQLTDMYTCGECGHKKCTFYQVQTRGADEPMDIFVTCLNCKTTWKD